MVKKHYRKVMKNRRIDTRFGNVVPFYYAVLSVIAEGNLVMDQTLKLPHRALKSTLYDMQHCHGHFRSDGSFDTLANPSRRVFNIILQLPIFSEPRELV